MQRDKCSLADFWGWFGSLTAIILLLLVSATFAGAAGHEGGPPFRDGEIVVAGAPGPHLEDLVVTKYLPNADLTVVKVEKGRELGMVQRFLNQGRRAGLNYIATASFAPNDYFYNFQWHFTAVQAEQAWEVSTGSGVTVAVLDTGLATDGNDGLKVCIEPGWDVVNNDSVPYDGDGHGTHVSGTIAQHTNNGTGVAGLAFDACIMPVKVLDDTGSGGFADIADGVYYAVDHGADVINMSLGTNARYNIRSIAYMDNALDYAYGKGVTVVCASGNDGSRKNVSYPAIYLTTIAVGATDYNNNVTRYSNKGQGLDLVAPGGDTLQDANGDGYADGVLQETKIDNSWGYWFFQGTSMASPHVAAAAALLIADGTASSPDEVYNRLTSTALDLGGTGFDSSYGHGLVQAADALNGSIEPPSSPPPPPDEGIDGDGDGYDSIETGGTDCDDENPDIHPDHPDNGRWWGRDGIDNDCDGIPDK